MMVVGIWVEHPFQLYSAKPIVEKYKKDGNKVILLTEIPDIKLCTNYLEIAETQVLNLNTFKKRRHGLFKKFFEICFVPQNFSIVYKKLYIDKESASMRFLRKIFFIKLRKENVNRYFIAYKKLLSSIGLHRNVPLNVDLLISLTKVNLPFLVPFDIPHISIMESWDHPMKFPYYINPDFNLTWNKDLKQDTKHFQHLNRIYQISPLKFRYIYERVASDDKVINDSISNTEYSKELLNLKGKDIILYPTTTSSIGICHEGEMKLIDEICQAIKDTKMVLYIKPKPNGPKGDYDVFKKYKNVIIGLYATNQNSTDMLNEEYQSFRYLLLRYSNVIINVGTTFVLEAAALDKPIIQLSLADGRFKGFGKYCKTYHLSKYILNRPGILNFGPDIMSKANLIEAINKKEMNLSKELKHWVSAW